MENDKNKNPKNNISDNKKKSETEKQKIDEIVKQYEPQKNEKKENNNKKELVINDKNKENETKIVKKQIKITNSTEKEKNINKKKKEKEEKIENTNKEKDKEKVIKMEKEKKKKKNIKKRISPKEKNINKVNTTKKDVKKRVVPKTSKNYDTIKYISLGILLLIIIIFYILFGIKVAAITTIGSAIIIGIGLLIRKKSKKKKKHHFINFLLIAILTLGILGSIGFGFFFYEVKKMADPIFEKKEKYLQTNETTILYDIEGKIFAKIGPERRTKIKYDDLPEVLIDAIVATEDSRYFQHNGFDAPRFIKATIKQLLGDRNAGGASTITMQVAKNTFSKEEDGEIASHGIKGILRKFNDIYISIFKLEKNYTKKEIIEFYVNNHLLGGNIYGVSEASEKYFGKPVSDLNLSEAAIIAGMFKSPNAYRPNIYPENAEKRRKTVLYLMEKHGYINEEEEKIANEIPVKSLIAENNNSNYNPYQGYIDTVIDEAEAKYKVNPYQTSLKVYTNLDRSKQDAVNKVFNGETYTWINDKVQCGTAVLDTQTGKILAIGARRYVDKYKPDHPRQNNFATSIKRQPGSTAKPLFDYGPGMEYNGWSTYTLFDDAPYTYSNGRSIKNWDGKHKGIMTLREALATSRNIPALKAFQQVENKKIIDFVTKLGLHPEIDSGHIHEAHSIGAFTGTNPLEMAAAYSAFANGGYYNEPYSINKIIYRSTGETKEHNADNYVIRRKAMSESTAFMITSVLQDVLVNGGHPRNVACKTGTTNYDIKIMEQEHLPGDAIRDSWIVGYSPKTAIGVWYGYEFRDKEYCLHNFPATRQKDYIFNALVKSGAMEANRESFKQPSSVVKVGVAKGSDPPKLATPSTQKVIYEYFPKNNVPTEYDEAPLQTPSNFKGTFDEKNNKVTLSWKAVAPSPYAKESYGKLGYNIYKNGVLLDWTDKTTYTFETTDPYTQYKIIATYKAYSGIQSTPAEFTLKKEIPKPKPKPEEKPNENTEDKEENTKNPTEKPSTPSDKNTQ